MGNIVNVVHTNQYQSLQQAELKPIVLTEYDPDNRHDLLDLLNLSVAHYPSKFTYIHCLNKPDYCTHFKSKMVDVLLTRVKKEQRLELCTSGKIPLELWHVIMGLCHFDRTVQLIRQYNGNEYKHIILENYGLIGEPYPEYILINKHEHDGWCLTNYRACFINVSKKHDKKLTRDLWNQALV